MQVNIVYNLDTNQTQCPPQEEHRSNVMSQFLPLYLKNYYQNTTLILKDYPLIFSSDIKIKCCPLDRNHQMSRALATGSTKCLHPTWGFGEALQVVIFTGPVNGVFLSTPGPKFSQGHLFHSGPNQIYFSVMHLLFSCLGNADTISM